MKIIVHVSSFRKNFCQLGILVYFQKAAAIVVLESSSKKMCCIYTYKGVVPIETYVCHQILSCQAWMYHETFLFFYPPLKSCSCFRREVGRVEIQLPVQQPTSPVHSLLPPDPTAVPRGLPSSSLPRTSCWAPQLAPPPGSSGSPSPAMSPRLCLLLPTVSFIYFPTFTLGNWCWNKSSMNWDESWLTWRWSPWPCPLMSIEKKCRFSFWKLFCGLSNHAN